MNGLELGDSGVVVSGTCLGTMTFGNQTEARDAHDQLDRALAAGVGFIDTAEMYPVNPIRRETVGRSEEIVGDWLAARGHRDRVQVATKVTGPSGMVYGANRAQLDSAHAQRIIGITGDGDQGLIALQACQAYAKEVSGTK